MLVIADVLDRVSSGDMVPMVATLGSYVLATIMIVSYAVVRIIRATTKERSRREIAAYVAEGSMSPDEAERLLNAGSKSSRCKS